MSTIPTTAQAWRFPVDQKTWNGHKSLELREVKITPPKQGEVLDIYVSKGLYFGPISTGPDGQGLIPASDGAGEVVAVGEGVTQWKNGDRVHSLFFETWFDGSLQDEHVNSTAGGGTTGCLTQYRIYDAKSLLPIPPHLSYEEAATIPCAALTAWQPFFEKRPITKDSTVLVLGSGGVSVFGAQLAKAAGARVIATTSSKDKEAKYKALGVDEVINYRDAPEWSSKVMELTGGKGVDQVLEVGGQGTLIQSIKSVERQGLVHIIGAVSQGNPGGETIQDLAILLLLRQVTASGSSVGSKSMCERLDAFITEHKIKPVVDRVFGWTDAIEALDYQLSGSHFGKIVIRID
ncbi:alcohol dehydrogenase zinc-binding domain protein [Rhizoctonia solani AG-1 IB]|uniref:Alcohol dehydrogenase zinc-binding domain protein n=1 Tax=Thanatephorus cucumeris (strain AG1-IB / isolate 7/3/14) TaxID=1108050 RepID=M5C662_THACB|nr:alcohol dehydrogenase zinc-binding domain protein [Rhizoctonia solani AG-1 IB]